MSHLIGRYPTEVQYAGLTTGSNVAYGVIEADKVHTVLASYVFVGQGHAASVESSPQPQSEEREYEVPGPRKQFPAPPTLSPPAVALSQDRETGTQEEAVYELAAV